MVHYHGHMKMSLIPILSQMDPSAFSHTIHLMSTLILLSSLLLLLLLLLFGLQMSSYPVAVVLQ
jgi:hypothetical protein